MSEKLLLELYERIVTLEEKVASLEKTIEKPVEKKNAVRSISEVNGKYRYLADYLANCGKDILDLTFDEIEDIVKSKLPNSCRRYRAMWANSDSRSIAAAWLSEGYITTDVDMKKQTVRFERRK
ncbi:MAG TPA: hypothetical protein PKX91_04080 [Clostridia bacterium]|jgi:uncharacterized coiled-coil protein SlyX|nr:hypothetical protein [Clostridia bacterium]